ncbi:hypothetical protein [Rhodoflexus caldus]|uniref:hypothetical protein n=1 Tax=Rhodoflexus caldus TaxID=2891236 RepID=UPI00202A49AC|nr:hypothetical protein [Rhodoflexus caldus]
MDHTEVIRCPRENANLVVAELALLLAFEAGRLAGQVDLEESYDLSQMADCVIEVAYSQKNAMPLKSASVGRTVTVNLRSDTWRQEQGN